MERTTSTWGVYILALSFSLAFTACGPVNRFTRVKRIPREYAMNYCGTDQSIPIYMVRQSSMGCVF